MSYRSAIIAIVVAFLGVSAAFAAGPFTGSWQVEIGIAPQHTKPFSSFSSTLDMGFHIGFVTLSSTSDFIFQGWLWQGFGLNASLAFITFDGGLLFEPQSGLFLYAHGLLQADFYPLSVRLYSAMTGQNSLYGLNYGCVLDLYGEIIGGYISIESATFLGADLSGITFTQTASNTDSALLTKTYKTDPTIAAAYLCFAFSGEEIIFKAKMFGCIDLTSTTTFSSVGFKSEEIELSFIHLFGLPLNITLDYVFTLQTASHTFTPTLETDYGCLKLYTHLLGSGGVITGIAITGIEFQASFAGVTVTSISNLNTTSYVITTPAYGSIVELKSEAIDNGHFFYPQDYWEVISLTVQAPGIGGGTFSFSATSLFGTSTGLLFNWGQSEMGVTVGIGEIFSISNSVTIDTTGFTAWKIGMCLSW